MIIEDDRLALTIDDLYSGDVFEAELVDGRGIFMKTDEPYISGDFKCVNLRTGEIYEFFKGEKVRKLTAKFLIQS